MAELNKHLKTLEARVQVSEPNGMMKVNIDHDGEGNEGVWACFVTPEDKEAYDSNKAGEEFDVFLLNHALVGGPTWGARLKLKSSGNNFRECIQVADVVKQIEDAVKSGDYPPRSAFD